MSKAIRKPNSIQGKMEEILVSSGRRPVKRANIGDAWDEVWTPDMSFLKRMTSGGSTKRSKKSGLSRKMVPLPPLPILLKTFLFSMKLCGLYHLGDELAAQDGRYTAKNFIILAVEKGMSFVVLIFCWGIVAFNLWHFPFRNFGFASHVFTSIVYLAFFLQNAISATTYFVASAHKKMFKKLFKKWAALIVPEDVAKDVARFCNKAQWIVICVGFIATAILIAELFFVSEDLQEIFEESIKTNTAEMEAYGILAIISVFIWVFSLGFFVLMCLVLRRLFYACHKALCREIVTNVDDLNLEIFRVRHEKVNSLLEIADKIYREMIFLYFFNYMLLLCLISYELLWMDSVGGTLLIRGVWCVIAVSTILVICLAASSINSVAHKSFKYLHRTDLTKLSDGGHVQLAIFLLRLLGPPLGLTAWGIFTVTRDVILTVKAKTMASVFMTYLLILAQLRPSLNDTKVAVSEE